jgi:hypothetical protein
VLGLELLMFGLDHLLVEPFAQTFTDGLSLLGILYGALTYRER